MPINSPYHSSMEKEIKKASKIVNSFFDSTLDADSAIPAEFIQNCAGLAFLTVVKAGFIWSGKLGTGLVISRLEDGSWSPPSGIGTAGVGFGAEIGGEIIDFMIVLGSQSAVKTFKKGTQISVGAGLDLAVGPVGRSAGGNLNVGGGGLSGNYTYSHAKGMFAGVGLHGSTILVRGDMNSRFYGREVSPMEILNGHVQPPPGSCDILYDAINRALGTRFSAAPSSYPIANQSAGRSLATSGSSSTSTSAYERTNSVPVSAPPPPGDDPRLRRYSQYKSEKELYAEYASRASGSTGPSQPQRATNVRTVPASTYAPAVSSTPSVERTPNLPPIPAATSGAETKEVYGNVINFITTRCPHANLQIFKDNCRRFGQDQMTLDAFFSYLTSICTRPLMIELVPQLVRLLPTKEKREHLWEVYTREILLIK